MQSINSTVFEVLSGENEHICNKLLYANVCLRWGTSVLIRVWWSNRQSLCCSAGLQTERRLSNQCRWVHGKQYETKQADWISLSVVTIMYVTVFLNNRVSSVALLTNYNPSLRTPLSRLQLSQYFTTDGSWEINGVPFFFFFRWRSLCFEGVRGKCWHSHKLKQRHSLGN